MRNSLCALALVVVPAAAAGAHEPAGPRPSAPAAAAAAPAPGRETGAETWAFLKAPLFSSRFAAVPVATVEDEVVTLRELVDALSTMHERPGAKGGGRDITPVLNRLINTRLIVLEAREMGLAELPEVVAAVEKRKQELLVEVLKQRTTDAVKPPAEDVDRLYKDSVREWKVTSLLFVKEEDARALHAAVAAGARFDELAAKAVADKKAQSGGEPQFLPRSEMLPEIVGALQPVPVGQVSAPVMVGSGWALMRVEDIRHPDNAAALADAEQALAARLQTAELRKQYQELVARHAKVDQALLKRLDFEAKKPGFAALLKDRRPLARIAGEAPITVAELAEGVAGKFYHGMEGPIREKRVNQHKESVFERLLSTRVATREAQQLRLQDSDEFKRRLAEHTNTLLFGLFVQRAIVPDARASEEECRRHYDENLREFSLPEFYKLTSLGFATLKDAQTALDKLRGGTDFAWLRANAAGQLAEEKRSVDFDNAVLSASGLAPDLGKTLAGAKPGDYRLWSKGEEFYVVFVADHIPPKPRPFEEVRESIARQLVGRNVGKAVESWAAKLRQARDVKVFITHIGG